MLTDTAKRSQEQTTVTEPQCVVKETPTRGLSEAIRRIQTDARLNAQLYLDEVITPFGGE